MSVFFAPVRVDFDWEGDDPSDVSFKILELEGYLENTQVLAEVLKEELIADMEVKFETETDPDGRAWQELVKPEAEQIGILRRGSTDAQMFHDAIDESNWSASPVGVFFDTGGLPSYWVHHEQADGGNYRIPQRAFIGPTRDAQLRATNVAATWLNIGVRRAGSMFRRPSSGKLFSPKNVVIREGAVGSIIGGTFRRQVRDPATGRFVSTKPNFNS